LINFAPGAVATVTPAGPGIGGRIVATVGDAPAPPTDGPAPGTGFTANVSNGGNIYYGPSSAGLGGTSGNTANVNGGVVILNGNRTGAISLGGSVTLNANGTAPKVATLDLTNASVQARAILGWQNAGFLR